MITVSHRVWGPQRTLTQPGLQSPTRQAINPLIFFSSIKFLFQNGVSQSGRAVNSRGDTSLLLVALSSLSERNQ